MTVVTGQIEQQHSIRSDDRVSSAQVVFVRPPADAMRTATPDLMAAFRIAVAFRIEAAFQLGPTEASAPHGIPPEDVDALMEWLRGDSLDWDAVARARDDAWR